MRSTSGRLTKAGDHRFRIGGGYEQVDIAHRGAHAAQAAGDFRRLDAGLRLQKGNQLLSQGPGAPEGDAVAAPGERFDAEDDLGFGLLAHAGQAAQLTGAGGGFQLSQVGDAQLVPEQAHLLGTQVGHLEQLHQRDGHFGGQLIVEPQVTGGEQLVDLLGDGFAHAGDLEQLALAPVLVDVAAQLA